MSVFEGIAFPEIIYETDSPINGHIQVVQAGNLRRLIADRFTQSLNYNSSMAQKRYWGQVVELLKTEFTISSENVNTLNSILILGLGGGTIQHLVAKQFPDANIVSIEMDPVMVDVAKKYFDLDAIKNHKIIIDDACRVIVDPDSYGLVKASFSAAVVDIFVGDAYPELGKSGNFLNGLRNLVVPDGLIVCNRHYTEEHQDESNNFIESIEMYLRDVKSLIIAGTTNSDNVLIYGRV